MTSFISILAVFAAAGIHGTYDVTEVLLYYQDTTKYKLAITQDTASDFFHLDWEANEGYKNSETGFEFEGFVGAYDFENCGLGIYKKEGDCLVGFRIYPVVMRLLQVTSEGCNPLPGSAADLSGFWNLEIIEGIRRVRPSTMYLNHREDGDYWDGGEFDSDFNDLTGGWGLVADDVFVIGFQHLDGDSVTLKIYSINGDTLEGRWIEGYYDHESGKTIIESSGDERAIRIPDTQ